MNRFYSKDGRRFVVTMHHFYFQKPLPERNFKKPTIIHFEEDLKPSKNIKVLKGEGKMEHNRQIKRLFLLFNGDNYSLSDGILPNTIAQNHVPYRHFLLFDKDKRMARLVGKKAIGGWIKVIASPNN